MIGLMWRVMWEVEMRWIHLRGLATGWWRICLAPTQCSAFCGLLPQTTTVVRSVLGGPDASSDLWTKSRRHKGSRTFVPCRACESDAKVSHAISGSLVFHKKALNFVRFNTLKDCKGHFPKTVRVGWKRRTYRSYKLWWPNLATFWHGLKSNCWDLWRKLRTRLFKIRFKQYHITCSVYYG